MKRVDGVVIHGLQQMDIHRGGSRNGIDETRPANAGWSSPWMQVEAGMAIALGKPVLVAPERGVEEGVFDRGVWTATIYAVAADEPHSLIVDRWAAAVHDIAA